MKKETIEKNLKLMNSGKLSEKEMHKIGELHNNVMDILRKYDCENPEKIFNILLLLFTESAEKKGADKNDDSLFKAIEATIRDLKDGKIKAKAELGLEYYRFTGMNEEFLKTFQKTVDALDPEDKWYKQTGALAEHLEEERLRELQKTLL